MKASHKSRTSLLPLSAVVLLTACIPPAPQPTPAPGPASSATPTPPPAPPPAAPSAPPPAPAPANWIDAPQTPGSWRYEQQRRGGVAMFGQQASRPRLALECNRNARQISITRPGQAGGATNMVIRTETASRSLTAQPLANTQPVLVTKLSARDPLLDAMALTRGRFAVETIGLPTLYLPAWGEVTRVIEDCR